MAPKNHGTSGLRELQTSVRRPRRKRRRRTCAPDAARAPIELRGRGLPAAASTAPPATAVASAYDPLAASLASGAFDVAAFALPEPELVPLPAPGAPEPAGVPTPEPTASESAPDSVPMPVSREAAWDEDADVAEAAAFADDLSRILAAAAPEQAAPDAGEFLDRAVKEAPGPAPATPPEPEEDEPTEAPRPPHEVFDRMTSFATQFDAGTMALDLERRFDSFDRDAGVGAQALEAFPPPVADALVAVEDLADIAAAAAAEPPSEEQPEPEPDEEPEAPRAALRAGPEPETPAAERLAVEPDPDDQETTHQEAS